MSGVATPPEITEPFGNAADPGTITLPIPITSATPGVASFEKGFPARTMQPIAAGGIPPFGPDANGILYMVSAHAAYAQAGQPYLWSATVAAAIGGYKKGTLLGMLDGSGVWINMTNGNMTNPDIDASNVGWQPFECRGVFQMDISGSGTITLVQSWAKKPVLIFIGALTGNRLLLLPPWAGQEWIIINACTGSGTVSVAATTQTFANIVIPAGGEPSPSSLYCDGINVFLSVSPPVVTGDVNATPNTLVQRDNAAAIFAYLFNSTAPVAVPTVGNVIVDSGNGYFQKISMLNFEQQVQLANLNGQVSNGQVPRAAAVQFNSGITATAGEVTIPLPSGLDIHLKWGQLGPVSDPGNTTVDVAVAFPNAFPNACVFGVCTSNRNVASNGQASNGSGFTSNRVRGSMTCTIDSTGGGVATGTWFAIGY